MLGARHNAPGGTPGILDYGSLPLPLSEQDDGEHQVAGSPGHKRTGYPLFLSIWVSAQRGSLHTQQMLVMERSAQGGALKWPNL